MKRTERKENANKGFSLVELIVVIAIMAVLIGLLAPQFLKYVERSRKSTDKQNVDAIISALEVYAVDEEVAAADQVTTGAKITLTTTETTVTATNATNNADKALTSAGIDKIGLKSSKWSAASIDLEVTIDANGVMTVIATDPDILE